MSYTVHLTIDVDTGGDTPHTFSLLDTDITYNLGAMMGAGMTDDIDFSANVPDLLKHNTLEVTFTGTLTPEAMEILAPGGLCSPMGDWRSLHIDAGHDHHFTHPRPHRLRDRIKAWLTWEKDWWPTLGYPLHPVRYYFPKVTPQSGGITYSRTTGFER